MIPDLLKYPSKGAIKPKRGINYADNKFDLGPDDAIELRNMLFVRDTLVQRRPFTAFSDTDFATPGRFRGAHDYQPPGDTARLLFYTNDGKIKEFLTVSTESDRVTGLATSIEGDFSTVYDAVVFCNGSDTPRVGRGTTWRTFGSPSAVSTLAVGTSAGATIAAGTYLHIVVPVIDVSGVAVVFADWSNIVRSVLGGAIGQFNLTWTDVVDSRITRYLIFRTEAGATDFRSVGVVNAGVGAFTDNFADSSLPVTVSGGPSRPNPQYSWGAAPIGSVVAMCGQRCVIGNIPSGSLQNAVKASRKAGNSYEAEGFPSDNSTLVRLPEDGSVTALIPIGSTDPNGRANDLFIAQAGACYILPETNPDYPLVTISEDLGIVSKDAWAKDGSFVFFKSKRGIEFWPGSGRDIYLISDRIQPIFDGGGNQALTANQTDAEIRMEIHNNQLYILVRDDATATGPNKAYAMDLVKFRKEYAMKGPSGAARFTGPLDNDEHASSHLGFGILLRRIDGTLINFDNQNNRILFYDDESAQDEIDATATNIPVAIAQTGLFRDLPSFQKILLAAHIYAFTNTTMGLTIDGEFGRVASTAQVDANGTSFEWDDINWSDIEWAYDVWFQDVALEFGEVVGKWFGFRLTKTDAEAGCAFFGIEFYYDAFEQIRTLK